MNILLIILIIVQSVFLYKQDMDSTLLKNELSSLKVELLSTQVELKKMAVSLENSANLAQKSNAVSDIIISDPSLFTYQNGIIVLGVVLVCALSIYSLSFVDQLGELVVKQHNIQLDSIKEIVTLSNKGLLDSTNRIITTELNSTSEIINHIDTGMIYLRLQNLQGLPLDSILNTMQIKLIEHMDHIVKNVNITHRVTVPVDEVAAALQNPIIGSIVDIATASL